MPEATGLESRILMTKNPADFRTRQVRVMRESNRVFVEPEGPEIDFRTMGSYRKPVPVEQVLEEIEGNGHLFANLGVSAYIVLKDKSGDYLVTVGQIRKSEGFSDKVAKLISGYVDVQKLEHPFVAILNEISEEFLPIASDGKFFSGRFSGLWLPQPYKEVAEYDRNKTFSLLPMSDSICSTDSCCKVLMAGRYSAVPPKIYYHANVNGAQFVFPLAVRMDLEKIEGISHSETELKKPAHLRHAEEKFEKGVLNAYMDPMPLYLLKLENNKLNGEVYTFLNGKLEPVDASGLVLSEAFVPSVHDGIIGANNITLKDYLAQK